MRKYLFASLLVTVLAVTGMLVFGGNQVEAQSPCTSFTNPDNVFPRFGMGNRENFGCAPSDSFLWMSTYHSGSTLNTPVALLRIFYNINQVNPQPFWFDSISFQTLNNSNHRCGSSIRIFLPQSGQTEWMQKPGGTCTINMPGNFGVNKNMLQGPAAQFGQDWRWIDLHIVQETAQSNAPIRIVSSFGGARITFMEQTAAERGPGNFSTQGSPYSFALWTPDMGGGTFEPLTYTLSFAPDCTIAPNQVVNVWLKWYDLADPGSGEQPQHFMSILVDDTTGAWVWSRRSDDGGGNWWGGNDQYREVGPIPIVGGHSYRWIWSGITRNNGVQVFMPFSEMSRQISCNDPPTGSLRASCTTVAGIGRFRIEVLGVNDPNGGAVLVEVWGSGGGGPNQAGWWGTGYHDFGTFNKIPDGSTYTATGRLRDPQTGQWIDMAPDSAACPRPPLEAACTLTTSLTDPPNTAEVGDTFELRITVRNISAQYAPNLVAAEHPLVAAGVGGVGGLGPAPGYPTLAPGQSATVTDPGVFSNTPGTYNLRYIIAGFAPQVDCDVQVVLGNKSYLKAFGGEVMAGGRFGGGACTPPAGRGGIHAWAESDGAGAWRGASSQLTVSSLLTVNEFYSVSNRIPGVGNTFPPKGLTLANNVAAQTWGGNFAAGRCITNYYTDTRDTTMGNTAWGGNNLPGGAGRIQYNRPGGGNIASSGIVNVPVGTQAAIYADGNIYIRNNIEYDPGPYPVTCPDGSAWCNAPNFVFITTGDIYIDSSVTRLDGLYIAQGGTIYTCARALNTLYNVNTNPALDVYQNCRNPLAVNGGLMANDIRWLRLRGTLRDAAFRENPNFMNGACNPPGCDMAEVINYTPQMWLAPSPLKNPSDAPGVPTTGPNILHRYDAIKSLPPIF